MDGAFEEPANVAPRAGRRARHAPQNQIIETAEEEPTVNNEKPSSSERAEDRETLDDEFKEKQEHNDNEESDPPAETRQGFIASPPKSFASPSPLGGFGIDNVTRPPPDGSNSDGNTKFAGISRRKQDQRVKEEEEKERVQSKYDELAERAAPIDGIMEIEEEGKEDMSSVVAEAPKVRSNKVQDIHELDEDMQYRLPAIDDREVDLSLLTAVLCSSEQVEEPDEVWDPDMLFTAVASELHLEKEKAEGPQEPSDGKEMSDQMSGLI